jgi:molybdopterin-guanine dinucleotide biosynthesis protein A
MKEGINRQKPPGVILAGGRSSRMGEEKTLMDLAGVTLLQRVIDRLAGQVSTMVISANGDVARFDEYKLPIIEDTIEGYTGPLAGILAGMIWAKIHDPCASHIVTIASDTPFFPVDLVEALARAIDGRHSLIAIPQTQERLHPAFGMWPVKLAPALEKFLLSGQRRVHSWLEAHEYVSVEFPRLCNTGWQLDPFFNINDQKDLEVVRGWLKNM